MQFPQHISRKLALRATVILLSGFALPANAQTWQTILDLQEANNADARGRALLVDPYSNQLAPFRIFVGGQIATQAAVLVFDQATTSYNRHDVPDAFRVNQIGVDPSSGNLFAAMLSYAVPNGRWQVSRSTDGGTNWTVADTFVLSTNGSANAWGFAADDAGNLFVTGRADDSAGQNHWVVRRSTDHGQSWNTVDDYLNGIPRRIVSVPGTNGGLFVVGTRYSGGWWTWTVRRSRDQGASWSTVDSGPQPGVVEGYANGVTGDGKGSIYVVGRSGGWTVRRSSNGGNAWQTIYSGAPTFPDGATDVAVDRAGNLWITGSYEAGWAVLQRDPGGVWQPMEFLGPAGGFSGPLSQGEAVAVDRAGDVFVTGWVRDAIGLPFRCVVQRRQSDTPILGICHSGPEKVLSWPVGAADYVLEAAASPTAATWDEITNTPTSSATERSVQLPLTGPAQFFRLRKP